MTGMLRGKRGEVSGGKRTKKDTSLRDADAILNSVLGVPPLVLSILPSPALWSLRPFAPAHRRAELRCRWQTSCARPLPRPPQ